MQTETTTNKKELVDQMIAKAERFITKHKIEDEDLKQDIYLLALTCEPKYFNNVVYRFMKKRNIMLTDIQDDTYIDGMDDEDAFNLYASITNEKFNSNLRDASNKIAKKDLLKVMETILTEREYFVLKSHFFDEMMLADIAKVIGLTAQGVRIIELKALQKIRYRGLAMKRLEGYLDDFY